MPPGRYPLDSRRCILLDQSRILEAHGELARAKDTCYASFQMARRFHHSDVALRSVANWTRLATFRGDQEAALATVDEMLPEARRSTRDGHRVQPAASRAHEPTPSSAATSSPRRRCSRSRPNPKRSGTSANWPTP